MKDQKKNDLRNQIFKENKKKKEIEQKKKEKEKGKK